MRMLDSESNIASKHVLTTTGTDAPPSMVQSVVPGDNATDLESADGSWMVLTHASAARGVRAVAATGPNGESRTWFETFNEQTEAWQKTSSTLALVSDTFEAGNSIIIEEDEAGGLQIRIETRLTRGVYF